MRKIEKYLVLTMLVFFAVLGTTASKTFAKTTALEITEGENDINPIPDKFNTGATEPKGGFQKVDMGGTFTCTSDGKESTLTFLVSGNTTNVFNLAYGNRDMGGTYVIENVDFSSTPVRIYGEETWDNVAKTTGKKMKFIFNNCKFKTFGCGRLVYENISYEFNNCSFENLNGSNLTATRCYFGGGYGDRINLFNCTYINYCYFSNPTNYEVTDALVHVDGVQIYGDYSTKTDIHDIYFDGCRFEIPTCKYPNAPNVSVNACIMLQLEFSNGYNMGFTNCILNGGGYTVYAHAVKDATSLTNVVFKNISVGGGRNWKYVYPDMGPDIDFNFDTWKDTDSLYVGSVWRDSKSTSISVTNDTNAERSFRVYTSSGKSYDYTIAACPPGLQMKNYTFEDLPFDVVYTIPEKADWVLVYELKKDETSGQIQYEQIRYKNFKNEAKGTTTKTSLVAFFRGEDSKGPTIKVCNTPNRVKISKLKAIKKGFSVKWKKNKDDIDGYQIQYSVSKDFEKKKNITIKSAEKNKYKKKKLKKKTKYYVRIRAYKTVKEKGCKYKVYGDWSKVKKIKTK